MDIEEIILQNTTRPLTQEEREKLRSWLRENPKNKKAYAQLRVMLANRGLQITDNGKEEVWDLLNKRIQRPSELRQKVKPTGTTWSWIKYAAIVLLSIGLGILGQQYLLRTDQPVAQKEIRLIEKTSELGEKVTTKLPDGTIVKLNSGSKLLFPSSFDSDERKVQLQGEAFFDVERNELKPFIIQIGEMEVQVLGTSFNVREDTESHQKTVAVKTGKVAVNNKTNGESVLLAPHQMVVETQSGALNKLPIMSEEAVFGWTDNKLVFDDNQYKAVLKEISKWFGTEIKVEKELDSKLKYTAVFDNPTLDEVLMSTSRIFKFNYKISENKVIIE